MISGLLCSPVVLILVLLPLFHRSVLFRFHLFHVRAILFPSRRIRISFYLPGIRLFLIYLGRQTVSSRGLVYFPVLL